MIAYLHNNEQYLGEITAQEFWAALAEFCGLGVLSSFTYMFLTNILKYIPLYMYAFYDSPVVPANLNMIQSI